MRRAILSTFGVFASSSAVWACSLVLGLDARDPVPTTQPAVRPFDDDFGDGHLGDVTIEGTRPVGVSVAVVGEPTGNIVYVDPKGNSISQGDRVMLWRATGAPYRESTDAGPELGDVGRYTFDVVAASRNVPGMDGGNLLELTLERPAPSFLGTGAEVVVVEQYENLTLAPNATLAAAPWDGSHGGIAAILVKGTLTISDGAKISAGGAGFRGGAIGLGFTGQSPAVPDGVRNVVNDHFMQPGFHRFFSGFKGESMVLGVFFDEAAPSPAPAPLLPNAGIDPLANGGGGGNGINGPAGGGGGNGTPGGSGGNAKGVGGAIGLGGAALVPPDEEVRLLMGGGGGGSGTDTMPIAPVAARSGAGGGVVYVRASRASGTGTIDVSGNAGYLHATDGSGGGGAGGTVHVHLGARECALAIQANGGSGGAGMAYGGGGGGGAGRVYLRADTDCATSSVSGDPGAQSSAETKPGPSTKAKAPVVRLK